MPRGRDEMPVIRSASFVAGATRAQQLPPPTGFEIAFAGRSNVGKSSLLNALMQRRNLVRTSSTPGCTRQISFFEVQTDVDTRWTLVDLPGYGYAKRSKAERKEWVDLIETYLLERPTLAAVAVLFDVRRGLGEEECNLVELLRGPPRVSRRSLDVFLVGTKLDKLPSSRRSAELARAERQVRDLGVARSIIGFSTSLAETHAALWRRIRSSLTGGEPDEPDA